MHKTGEVQTTCLLTEIFCFFPTQKHEHKGTKREPRTQACTSGIPGLGRIDPYDTHIKAETEPNKKLSLKREITVQAQSGKSLYLRYPLGRKDKTIKKKSAPNATCASRHSTGWAGAIRTRGTRFRGAVLCPLSYGGALVIVALIVCASANLRNAEKSDAPSGASLAGC
mgnify:CR=1 FL=1